MLTNADSQTSPGALRVSSRCAAVSLLVGRLLEAGDVVLRDGMSAGTVQL
jgi:hypothetical protein